MLWKTCFHTYTTWAQTGVVTDGFKHHLLWAKNCSKGPGLSFTSTSLKNFASPFFHFSIFTIKLCFPIKKNLFWWAISEKFLQGSTESIEFATTLPTTAQFPTTEFPSCLNLLYHYWAQELFYIICEFHQKVGFPLPLSTWLVPNLRLPHSKMMGSTSQNCVPSTTLRRGVYQENTRNRKSQKPVEKRAFFHIYCSDLCIYE